MVSIAILTVVFAVAAADSQLSDLLNNTNIDRQIIRRITTVLDSNRTLDNRDIALINRTAQRLGIDKDIVIKITNIVKQKNDTQNDGIIEQKVAHKAPSYVVYEDDNGDSDIGNIGPIEESPDYASSVVLASDLLSLTSAVASVQGKTCREQGYQFLNGLLHNKRWALKMFDASAKSPQGLLFGSSYHLGNFDECVDIGEDGDDERNVDGRYCLATIKWRKKETKKVRSGRGEILRWAVCVPRSCDAESVETFVATVVSRAVGNTTTVQVTDRDCSARKSIEVSRLDIGYLSFVIFFFGIILLCTLYETFSPKICPSKRSVTYELITCFSLINNLKKIISVKETKNSLGLECVAGIKALTMIFILFGHACLFIGTGPVMDASSYDRILRNPLFSLILQNTLLVDTFLMLSAFLFCRLLLLELDKRSGKVNIIPILVFRYLRVTPAYLVVILFYMTWLPKTGEGPLWGDRIKLEQERCLDSWWANLLYINNYINTDKLCMFQSWYLSVDTQMFFIAPIYIYSLWHWRRFGKILLGGSILATAIIPSAITYIQKLDPTSLYFAKEFTDISSNDYFKGTYIKTHFKMVTYFLGILTAYILHRIQSENHQLTKKVKIIGWVTSLTLGTAAVVSVSVFYQKWYVYNPIEAAAYISLHKIAWCIANGWLLIACATGNGGILANLFKWKFLVPISRLTFCAYLMNGIVELYYVGQLRHPVHLTLFIMLANTIAHIVLTFGLALMLCVTFESPIHGFEKILLRMFARPTLSDNARASAESSRNTSQSKLDS